MNGPIAGIRLKAAAFLQFGLRVRLQVSWTMAATKAVARYDEPNMTQPPIIRPLRRLRGIGGGGA
ncbi:hypothetical protein OV079_18235 [Nannocystis pusilla]|uniref:Uncharacterized protein n=1 Tax=Nannocystis pusilla TaxID=889268 RepID=A0A9X3IYD1_9BACT|nr:hypothetical protein [Nannocystis pusilla]MCY1007454.1 hypothetical protein [Nannocystis pusilla]